MELRVSPDLTVYLAGRAGVCLAPARLIATSRSADGWTDAVNAVAVAAVERSAGACPADANAAGALASATAAATPNSAGAAATGRRRLKRGRACFAGLPKGFLPE